MMSEDAERFAPLRKFMQIDLLVDMHDQLEFDGKANEAEDLGDFLHKLGKGYFPWLLPLGPDPRIGAWLNQLAEKDREERCRKMVKQWTDRDTQMYRRWLDAADEAEQAQVAEQERGLLLSCDTATSLGAMSEWDKDGEHDFPVRGRSLPGALDQSSQD